MKKKLGLLSPSGQGRITTPEITTTHDTKHHLPSGATESGWRPEEPVDDVATDADGRMLLTTANLHLFTIRLPSKKYHKRYLFKENTPNIFN